MLVFVLVKNLKMQHLFIYFISLHSGPSTLAAGLDRDVNGEGCFKIFLYLTQRATNWVYFKLIIGMER